MIGKLITRVFGTKRERDVRLLQPLVDEINGHFESYRDLSEDALREKTDDFRRRLAGGETTDDILPEAFAAVKDACRRLLGRSWHVCGMRTEWNMVPYDVQLMGAIILYQGKIAEMATGEGKTLVATMPLYLNALEGKGAHLITVNDYLARRDREWMGGIFEYLGLSVGVIQHDMDPPTRQIPVRLRHHVRNEQRVRVRFPAGQHGDVEAEPSPARIPLRDRRRGRLGSHRRSPHAAHHFRPGRSLDAKVRRGKGPGPPARPPPDRAGQRDDPGRREAPPFGGRRRPVPGGHTSASGAARSPEEQAAHENLAGTGQSRS